MMKMRDKKHAVLLIMAVMLLISPGCGKQTREATATPEAQKTGSGMSKEDQKMFEASMEADAITMAKASCVARTAKKEADRRPESEFYVKKAENLIAQRNKIRNEMDAKYGEDPETKKLFEAAVEKAKLGLEECKGYNPDKNKGQ
jgi:hypothetical protein